MSAYRLVSKFLRRALRRMRCSIARRCLKEEEGGGGGGGGGGAERRCDGDARSVCNSECSGATNLSAVEISEASASSEEISNPRMSKSKPLLRFGNILPDLDGEDEDGEQGFTSFLKLDLEACLPLTSPAQHVRGEMKRRR